MWKFFEKECTNINAKQCKHTPYKLAYIKYITRFHKLSKMVFKTSIKYSTCMANITNAYIYADFG